MGLVAMRIFSSFLFSVMLIFIALFCSLPSALARPNFVLVLTDDMEVAPVGYMYWTKTLIRAQGVAFQRAYVASPLCAPARATILTGRYPQNTGVRRNSHKAYYEQGNPARSLPVWLHDAGYRTALIGKYMNGYPAPDAIPYIPPGWDMWSVRYRAKPYDGQYNYWLNENGKPVYYGNRPEHYATDVYRKKAVAFIKETVTHDAPFFLQLAVHAPHTPFVPAARHASQFPTVRAPRSGPGIAAGLKLDHLVANVDIAPTILELAGVPIPAEIDGRSFAPLLGTGRPSPDMWRQVLAMSFQEGDDAFHVPTWQGIRTQRYTYVEYPGTGERELYDDLLDPHQLANIAATADQTLMARLSERSRLLAACAQVACREAEDLALP